MPLFLQNTYRYVWLTWVLVTLTLLPTYGQTNGTQATQDWITFFVGQASFSLPAETIRHDTLNLSYFSVERYGIRMEVQYVSTLGPYVETFQPTSSPPVDTLASFVNTFIQSTGGQLVSQQDLTYKNGRIKCKQLEVLYYDENNIQQRTICRVVWWNHGFYLFSETGKSSQSMSSTGRFFSSIDFL